MVPKAILVCVVLGALAPSWTSASIVSNNTQCTDGEECSQSPVFVQKKQVYEARALAANTEEEVEQGNLNRAGQCDATVPCPKIHCKHPVTVCGCCPRCSDHPLPIPPSLQTLGFNDDQNPGGSQYQTVCQFAKDQLHDPGCGGFSDFAVAHCTEHNCVLYRVFDEQLILPNGLLGGSPGCGHYWAPPASIENKSRKQYLEDAAVCPYPDKWVSCAGKKPTDGNKGTYLLKCHAKNTTLFSIGPGQSQKCQKNNGDTYILGPSPAWQINWGTGELDCMYCKNKETNVAECENEPRPFKVTEDMFKGGKCR